MLRGIDISSCQGVIQWGFVPSDIRFVVVKVAEGDAGKDPMRAANLAGARAYGKLVGAYCFLHPGGDPAKEAQNMWDATGDTMPALPPALDLESGDLTGPALVAWFLRAADAVESLFGRPPLIYTYPWFEQSKIAPGLTSELADRLGRCPLWMADYAHGEQPHDGQAPFCPPPWRTWALWQTSGNNSSKVAGINGPVDHDVFNGDESALMAFCNGGAPVVPDASPTVPTLPDETA